MYFLQIIDDRKTKNVIREKCMESVKRFVTGNDGYLVKEIKYDPNPVSMLKEIDTIRFSYAKEHNDLFYVDTDCFLAALPSENQLKLKKIVVGGNVAEDGSIDTMCIFYVNGQKDFFLKNYDSLIKTYDSFGLSPEQRILLSGNTISYDNMSYCHFSFTSLEININKQFKIISDRLTDAEKEVNAYRNSIQSMISTVELYDKLRAKSSG